MFKKLFKDNSLSVLILFTSLVLPLVTSSLVILFILDNSTTIASFSISNWIAIFLLTSITMALALTPTTFVAMVTGYFIGWWAILGIVPSYGIASFIGFTLASYIDGGKLSTLLRSYPKLSKITNNVKKDEFNVVFFCRISPALPFAMMNIFLAFLKIGKKSFYTASLVGMLPRTLFSIWIGTQANSIVDAVKGNKNDLSTTSLLLLLVMLSLYGLFRIFMKAKQDTN